MESGKKRIQPWVPTMIYSWYYFFSNKITFDLIRFGLDVCDIIRKVYIVLNSVTGPRA